MRWVYSSLRALLLASAVVPAPAQEPAKFTVFVQGRAIGTEQVTVGKVEGGFLVGGSGAVAPPVDTVTRKYEVRYDEQWNPVEASLEGVVRGQPVNIRTSFAAGSASSQISQGTQASSKTDQISAGALVLLNQAVTSYEALAARAHQLEPGEKVPGYILPQRELPIRLGSVTEEMIQTPAQLIRARRYHFIFENPSGELSFELWADATSGRLLRVFVPTERYEVVREDIASVAARRVVMPRENDEQATIPASGFNLAATISHPAVQPRAGKPPRLPAVVLVGGQTQADRDEIVGGVPIFAQFAARLADAGFRVVRYDKRGVGQSGGRAEQAGIEDYADDVQAVVKYLTRRNDVDKQRIAVIGYAEGGWVALSAASRDKSIGSLVLLASPGSDGAGLILEQQRLAFIRLGMSEEERKAKTELQLRINEAVRTGKGWEGIPEGLRRQADTAWFQSFLTFAIDSVVRKTRQPMLVVHGGADNEIPPHHAEFLADKARARKKPAGSAVAVTVVPGVNHLLVEGNLEDAQAGAPGVSGAREVDPRVVSAVVSWLQARLLPPDQKKRPSEETPKN
ncbi:MAG: alpha/beta hydrolase family protein [Vicinamibacterales bacterium]